MSLRATVPARDSSPGEEIGTGMLVEVAAVGDGKARVPATESGALEPLSISLTLCLIDFTVTSRSTPCEINTTCAGGARLGKRTESEPAIACGETCARPVSLPVLLLLRTQKL